MRKIAFLPQAFEDFYLWATENRKIYTKIMTLIKDIDRHPFSGLGKPEPLKRITKEHRLVYRVTDEEIIVVSCKFHY